MLQATTTPELLVFTSLAFVVLFAGVWAVHWSLRRPGSRKVWLLVVSYGLYATWNWRFLSLILLSTGVDYLCGLKMSATEDDRTRRRWLLLSLVTNLGLLATFKYANWFVDSAIDLARWSGWAVSERTFAILLPVGISFYTFQTLSYTIDVYRRELPATRSLLDFSLFVAFFPQLVAGPIVRARELLPQLQEPRSWRAVDVRACLVLFLVGYVQKRCIADNLAVHVDQVFFEPAVHSASALRLALLLFSFQIYGDFAGYSNMAIACGGLLGYRLPRNFDRPYLSPNIVSFWRRWHITLSQWLRDYLYIPLGGNRGGVVRSLRNVFVVMLLGGLWHGAGWNFLLWGGLHAVAIVACQVWLRWRRKGPEASERTGVGGMIAGVLGAVATFAFVTLAWIPFRTYTFEDAVVFANGVVRGMATGTRDLPAELWWVAAVLAGGYLAWTRVPVASWLRSVPSWVFGLLFGAAVGLAAVFSHRGVDAFVYFQF